MNNKRREQIARIQSLISDEVVGLLDEVHSDEEAYMEAIPENLQSSERYEIAEAAVYALEEAMGSIEEVVELLDEAVA